MKPGLVVFDIGGVMIRICHQWGEAAARAGVAITNPNPGRLSETAFIDEYQKSACTPEEYLEALRAHLGCQSSAEALRVHNSILIEEYPGILDLVKSLKSQGIQTACLSNTADLHWQEMLHSGRFPAFEALDHRFASHIEELNKPHPEIYRRVTERTGVPADQSVFFDDYEVNVLAARELGWNAVRISPDTDTAKQASGHLYEIFTQMSI